MTNSRLLVLLGLGLMLYSLGAWLLYVEKYRQSRIETLARLILNGSEHIRERLLREEGITNA